MSQKWRNKNRPIPGGEDLPQHNDDGNEVVRHNEVMAELSWDDEYNMNGTMLFPYTPDYPVQREVINREADAYTPARAPVGYIKDLIDYEVGGQAGEIDGLPYSTGVVSSDLVEDFTLTGEQAIIRRMRNPASQGAVGTSDYNTTVGLAYAASANQFYPNEASQADLVKAV